MQLYDHFLWIHVLHWSIFFSIDSQASGNSCDCPSAMELSQKNIYNCLIPNQIKTHQRTNTVFILGTYFNWNPCDVLFLFLSVRCIYVVRVTALVLHQTIRLLMFSKAIEETVFKWIESTWQYLMQWLQNKAQKNGSIHFGTSHIRMRSTKCYDIGK